MDTSNQPPSKDNQAGDVDLFNEWLCTGVIALSALVAGLEGAWALSLCGVMVASVLAFVLWVYAADRRSASRHETGEPLEREPGSEKGMRQSKRHP